MNFINEINQLFENKRFNRGNSNFTNDQEIEKAVEKMKYSLEEGLQYKNIISDCLARLLNDNESKCVSVYLHLEKTNSDKDILEKLYFCSKSNQNENGFREKVLNLLNYCLNSNRNGSEIKFFSDSMKNRIIDKIKRFQNTTYHSDLCYKHTLKKKNPINDLDFLKNLVLGMYKYNPDQNDIDKEGKINAFYYTLIIVFDLLTIPSLFEHYFSINSFGQDLNLDKKIKVFINQKNDTNQHPDSVIAYKISTLVSLDSLNYNRYVGVSLMPCFYCKLFLESFKFGFRGLTSTIYKLWQIPTRNENETDHTITAFFNTFNAKLEDHIEKLRKNKTFSSDKSEDRCQRTCIHMSDDIDVCYNFLNFCKQKPDFNNNSFFNSFDQNERKEVKSFSDLINVLYNKRSFCDDIN
jgi:hypothetical protein